MKALALTAALVVSALPFLVVLCGGLDGFIGVVMPGPPVPGDSDTYEQAWHFWWVGRTIAGGGDPRTCSMIGLPAPHSLVGQNIGWPDAVVFGSITRSNPRTAMYLSLLWGTLLVTSAGFLFSRSWGLGLLDSAFAAVLMAWAPARTAHVLQHYHIAGFGWVLLSMACLRMFLRNGKTAFLPLFGISLVLASMQSAYHTLSGSLGAFIVAAATLLSGRLELRRTLAAAGVFAFSIFLSFLFFDSFPGGMPPGMGRNEAVYWSAEPLSFLLPSPFGIPWSLSGADQVMWWMPNLFEGVVTPGFMVLILAMAALMRRGSLQDASGLDRKGVRLLALFSLLPFTLALGPWLKFLGQPLGIPLPFALLQDIPMLEGARSPSRFAILGACLLIVPAASTLRSLGIGRGILVVSMTLLEVIPPGLPTISDVIPSVYSSCPVGEYESALEIPATQMARRYGYFMTADGRERPIFFHTRRSAEISDAFDPFLFESEDSVTIADAHATGVDVIYYNRWLFEPAVLVDMDSRFRVLFPGASDSDSVWIWRR